MEAEHLTWAAEGRQRLFPEEGQQLAAVRGLARCAGSRLWSFCLADDHGHAIVAGNREEVTALALGLGKVLRARDGSAPLQRVHRRPIEGRGHLERSLTYHVRQPAKHGLLDVHPARWPGSSFADLVGARVISGLSTRGLQLALPRLDLVAHMLTAAGLPTSIGSAADADLVAIGLPALWAAVLAACGFSAAEHDTPGEVAARAVFVGLVERLGLSRREGCDRLGITDRSWRRLVRGEPDAIRIAAVRRRVAIDRWVHANPVGLSRSVASPEVGRSALP